MRLLYGPGFAAALSIFFFALARPATAQDTIYSHWPGVTQGAYAPAQREALFQQISALLAKPVPKTPARLAAPADGSTPGWATLNEARRRFEQRDFSAASRSAEQALDTARRTGDRRLEMRALHTIGSIAREVFLGASLKAVPYHERALVIAQELRDSAYTVTQLISLADNYGQAGQNDRFLDYLGRAIPILNAFDLPASRMGMGEMFGCFLETQGEKRRAETMFRATIPLARAIGNLGYAQHLYWQLYWLHLGLGDTVQAEADLDTAQMTGSKMPDVDLYEARYQLEKQRGHHEQAFHYLEQAYRGLGADYTRRSAEQLAGWETRLRTQEKELQLEAQRHLLEEQKKWRLHLYGLIALVSILLFGSLVAWHRQRQAKRALHEQNRLIEKQATELTQLDQLKSRFFANVSHELRTPLTLILGPIDQVLKDSGLSRYGAGLLKTAQRNSLQLLNLVNEILDLSKLRATRPDVQEQPTVLFDFLEETAAAFQPLAESRGIGLSLHYWPEKSWTLALDRQKLLKIVNNLLSNALKYAPPGSTVVLHTEQLENEVQLQVSDSGPGIHPDDLPYIFDLYYQSKRPEAKAEGGTGIGLAYSMEMALALGGRLWAESTPGRGSTFFLALPVHTCALEEAVPIIWGRRHIGEFRAPERQPAQAPAEISARLLVVEDNPDLQDYLRVVLPGDYALTIVDNGRAALDYLEHAGQAIDLILSDVMMPQMDGFQLLERLRASERWRSIPVILLTALAEPDDRLHAFRLGIDDYILKPFAPEELQVRIENALRNLAVRREWLETTAPAGADAAPAESDAWLQQLQEMVQKNLGNPQFNIDHLAERMNIGRTAFYRQVREKTGLSANQFIQELRLLQARHLLESGRYQTLRQVADAVGFRSADYLSRLYRARFGKSPVEYL